MTLAIIFFLLYLAAVVTIGLMAARKESEEDFMMAGRKVKGIQLAATMSAGFFDGAILAIYLSYIYQFGLAALWLFIGLGLGFFLLRRFAQRIKQLADTQRVYTMPEYFFRTFGKRCGLMFSIMLIVQFFLLLIVNLIISAKVLTVIFPLPYAGAVLMGGIIVLTYLWLAGFKAVIRTDFFQLLIMILMSVMAAVVLLGQSHIPTAELNIFNFTRFGIGDLMGFLILGTLGIMVTPDLWQRIFATHSQQTARRGLAYAAMILVLLAVVISVVGLVTKQFFPNIAPADALVTGFANLLPGGLMALGLVLLYAVALSSSDTVTFVVSSIVTRDLQNYLPRYSETSMRRLTRFFMVLFVLCGVSIAVWYQDILALGFSLASISVALFPVVFGSFYWQLKEPAVFWSSVLALVSIVVLFAGQQLSPQTAVISLPLALVSLIVFQRLFKDRALVSN